VSYRKQEPEIVEGLTDTLICQHCGDPIKGAYRSNLGKYYHVPCSDVVGGNVLPVTGPGFDDKPKPFVPVDTAEPPGPAWKYAKPPGEGAKYDGSKERWDLLPIGPTIEVVKVLTFGARKYADNNWQKVEHPRSRYFSAALRHLTAWFSGARADHESGLSHLAHAICCLLFCLWFEQTYLPGSPPDVKPYDAK
jgi:Domain of unknown function (DUF5664)